MLSIKQFTIICSLCVAIHMGKTTVDAVKTYSPCEETCREEASFEGQNSSNEMSMVDSCSRGCRFYTIVEVLNKSADQDQSLKSCFENCQEAYPGLDLERGYCRRGCSKQQPFFPEDEPTQIAETDSQQGVPELREDNILAGALYPLMLMRSLYRSLARHSTTSLSVFSVVDRDGHPGRVVVVRSQPQVVIDFAERRSRNFEDFFFRPGKTPFVNTTEVLRRSQLNPSKYYGNEINAAQATSDPSDQNKQASSGDWLSCLAQRTGMPRIFICGLLLLTALSMVWLCMSAAVTAPNQHVKLSINSGDLSYIRSLPEKKGILGVYPQAKVEARPLPTKIRVEQL